MSTVHIDPTPAANREGGWGAPLDRANMSHVAQFITESFGFKVCALEARRGDDQLELVALHGEDEPTAHLGEVFPLDSFSPLLELGERHGSLVFLAAETRTPAERAADRYRRGLVFEVDETLGADIGRRPWHPDDFLAAPVTDDEGRLRAMVFLDLPEDGLRPTPEQLDRLSARLQPILAGVLSVVEREAFAHQARVTAGVRRLLRSLDHRMGVHAFLDRASTELLDAFRAYELVLHVSGDDGGDERLTPLGRAVHDVLAGICAWPADSEGVVVLEAGEAFGDEVLTPENVAVLSAAAEEAEVGTVVLVPVRADGEHLGELGIVRARTALRWTDSESGAALDVARDLGRALLNARLQEREQRVIDELQRLDTYRQQLIATVAHELKNPIGVIEGHLEILDGHAPEDPLLTRSLNAIGRGAGRLGRLAADLLVLSRLGDPGHPLDTVPVDLGSLTAEVVEFAQVTADLSGVRLAWLTPPQPVLVDGDWSELERVVTNLVSNALKYSDAGGDVHVELAQQADVVLLTCADHGIGITPEDAARLFDDFFRSTNPAALSRPGTGLGLSIVRRIVERHGGTIEVDSTPGVGTTVRVRLPAAAG